MNGAMSPKAMVSGLGFFAAMAAFLVMLNLGFHQTVLLIPIACAWAVALIGLRPMVAKEHHAALYFAFGIMALMIFFVHETYEMKGKVRTFPLIIGYSGIVLSALDIASVTETVMGRFVTRVLGAMLDPKEIKQRRVTRELVVFAVMSLGVLSIWLLGFLIASPIFVFLWVLIGGGKSLKMSLYVGIATLVFIVGLFEMVLKYELFRGVVTIWIMETIFE